MNIDIDTTVAFTGHRNYDGSCGKRLRECVTALYADGYRLFMTGMAAGFDLAAGEAVVQLQDELDGLLLGCIIPYEGHITSLTDADRRRYRALLMHAATIVTTAAEYDKTVFLRRDDFLVDNSSVVVAYFDGHNGGTAYTVGRAVKKGRRYVNLWLDGQQEFNF